MLLHFPDDVRQLITSWLDLREFVCTWRLIHPACKLHKQLALTFWALFDRCSALRLPDIYDRIECVNIRPERKAFEQDIPALLARTEMKALTTLELCGDDKLAETVLLTLAEANHPLQNLDLCYGWSRKKRTTKKKANKHKRIVSWLKDTGFHLQLLNLGSPTAPFLRMHFNTLIQHMPNLTELHLAASAWPNNDSSLENIAISCRKLKCLGLFNSNITALGIASLAKIQPNTINDLMLFDCKNLTDECIPFIGALSLLEELDLDGSGVDGRKLLPYGIKAHCDCEEFCQNNPNNVKCINDTWRRK